MGHLAFASRLSKSHACWKAGKARDVGRHACTNNESSHTPFNNIGDHSKRCARTCHSWSWRQLQQPIVSMIQSQLNRFQLPLSHTAACRAHGKPSAPFEVCPSQSLRLQSITKATKKALPQMELWPCHCMGRPCQVPANTTLFASVRCRTTQGDGGELTWCSRSIRP